MKIGSFESFRRWQFEFVKQLTLSFFFFTFVPNRRALCHIERESLTRSANQRAAFVRCILLAKRFFSARSSFPFLILFLFFRLPTLTPSRANYSPSFFPLLVLRSSGSELRIISNARSIPETKHSLDDGLTEMFWYFSIPRNYIVLFNSLRTIYVHVYEYDTRDYLFQHRFVLFEQISGHPKCPLPYLKG